MASLMGETYAVTKSPISASTGPQMKSYINISTGGYRSNLSYSLLFPSLFSGNATTPLEEWLDYLKNNHIKEDTTAPGLQEARRSLQYLKMNNEERQAYDRHLDNIMVQNDVLDTAKMEGRAEGRAEVARNMLAAGMDDAVVMQLTGFSFSELQDLK